MTRAEQKANKERMFLKELIDKMFELAGHNLKFEDVEGRTDNWFQQYTMTEAQNKEWREWGIKYLKKQKGLFKHYAERQMAMFDLMYGLKLEQNDKMEI